MQIATQGRPAVIAMLDLAFRTDHGPIALATMGARQKISPRLTSGPKWTSPPAR